MKTQNSAAMLPQIESSGAGRVAVFAYGVLCYAIGVAGLCALIGVSLGLIPFTGGPLASSSTGAAIALNLSMVAVFGIQHAIMARPEFKARWTRIIPAAAERPTFTMLAGGLMATMMWLWQPLPATVWAIETPALQVAIRAISCLGWVYLLAATFAINHFELFGLQQVYLYLRGSEARPLPMVTRWMYHFDRHPIMSGFLVALWANPLMSLGHLVLAGGLTAYIVVGVAIEERDLVRSHGDAYREYREKVGSLVPRISRG